MSMKKLVLVICAALVVGVSAWFFVLRENGNEYETFIVEPGDFIQQISTAGTVVSADSVELGFAQSGRVARTYVEVGNNVMAGAVLEELENGDLQATILQKKAAREPPKTELVSLQEGS